MRHLVSVPDAGSARLVEHFHFGWGDAQFQGVPGLVGVKNEFAGEAVLGGPVGCVGAPVEGEIGLLAVECVGQDRSAGKVAGRADDLSTAPVVFMHDLGRVDQVLDCVLSVGVLEDGGCRYAF